jgi:protein-L-isoaspartate O-methyltransferase
MQDKIAQFKARLKEGVKVRAVQSLFQTPYEVAKRAAELLEAEPSDRILEPSAGMGDLIAALPAGPSVVAVEKDQGLCDWLERRFHGPRVTVFCADFLGYFTARKFDRILMNPPFDDAADIKHVNHALTLLKTGGTLVAIIAGGPRQERVFKNQADFWERLPPGTFAGTNVSSILMRIRK